MITNRIRPDTKFCYQLICDILGFFKIMTLEIPRGFSLAVKKGFKCAYDPIT